MVRTREIGWVDSVYEKLQLAILSQSFIRACI